MAGTTGHGFADHFQAIYPNIAWAVRNSPTAYPDAFQHTDAYQHLVNNTPDFLQSTELDLLSLYNENQALRSRIAELDARVTGLEPLQSLNISQRDTITSQRNTITTLKLLVEKNNTQRTNEHKKKRQSADPDKFSGKGSPTERQQDFETWIVKIESVFARDLDHFENVQSQILYISDMLTGKAYEYIKDGVSESVGACDDSSTTT
jgi:hypothetical protein